MKKMNARLEWRHEQKISRVFCGLACIGEAWSLSWDRPGMKIAWRWWAGSGAIRKAKTRESALRAINRRFGLKDS